MLRRDSHRHLRCGPIRRRGISACNFLRSTRNSPCVSGLTLGELFNDLPAEIQTQALAYLSASELLNLRTVSKHSLSIFQSNGVSIARGLLLQEEVDQEDGYSTGQLIHQYPSIFSSTMTDAYFLRSLRRETLARKQLRVLLTFIQTRTYMLKLTRDLQSEHFAPYRDKLTARLYQPVILFGHFLEAIRHLILYTHPHHQSSKSSSTPITIDRCAQCTSQLRTTLSSYPTRHIVPLYVAIQLLIQHFYTATRSPSSVTIIERKLKGWGYGPPPDEHMAQLVFLGGIQELSKLDEMRGSYGKRLSVVKNFSDIVAEAVRINSLAFPDFYQSGTDPVMAMAGISSKSKSKSKGKGGEGDRDSSTMVSAMPKAIRRDKDDVRTGIEARADEVSVVKSLDVRLDLLTGSVIASIPNLGDFFVGPKTLLGRYILELKLVNEEVELVNTYALLTKLMFECYEPVEGPSVE